MALQLEIIDKSGAWFYLDGERLGQGKDNVRKLIETDAELMAQIEGKIKEKMKNMTAEDAAEALDDDDFEIKDFDDEL
jgi:recombination protein RecA